MDSDEYYRKKYLKYKAKYIKLIGGKHEEAFILTKKETIKGIYKPTEPIIVKNCYDFLNLFLTTDGAIKAHMLKLNKMDPITQKSKFCEPVDKLTLTKFISKVTKKTQELAKDTYKYMEPTLKEVGKEVGKSLKETGKILGDVAKDVVAETGKSLTTTIGTSGQALAVSAATLGKTATQQLQSQIEQKTQKGVEKIQMVSAPKAPPMPVFRPKSPSLASELQKQKSLLKSPQLMQKGGGLDKVTLTTLLKDSPSVNIDNILETMLRFQYDMIIRVKFGKPMPDKQGTVTLEFLPIIVEPIKLQSDENKLEEGSSETPNPFMNN